MASWIFRSNLCFAKKLVYNNSSEIGNYLKYYIKRAEEFVLENKELFLRLFNDSGSHYWNEILVNNIKVKDVLLYHKFDDIYFVDNMVKQFGTLEKLKEILESFSSGKIYITFNPKEAVKFVEDRKQT